jgi:hypothetical protein
MSVEYICYYYWAEREMSTVRVFTSVAIISYRKTSEIEVERGR